MVSGVAARDVPLLRCRSQRIHDAPASTPGDVVRHLLAVQAQDLAAARWAVGLRAPGATSADVAAALASGEVVRSWPLRGTLHLVAGEDLGWLLTLTPPRVVAAAARRHAELGIDDATIERARGVAERALEGGRELTREGMLAALESASIATDGGRGYHLIGALARTGTLVWGRLAGDEQVLVLLDAWVRARRRLDRDAALGELAARYVAGRGPVTREDLQRWAGLGVADAKRALAIADRRVVRVDVEGTEAWVGADLDLGVDAGARRAFAASMVALPGFDEYLLGYADRRAVLDPAHEGDIVPGGNGVFLPTIVAGGRVVGTWKRATRARRVEVTALPFDRLTPAAATRFAAAAGAYGRFVGAPLVLA